MKRRHEAEEDEDLQEEEEVERLSFYDCKDDSDVENDVEGKTDIPESISVFKKSKVAYKKRKMAHMVRVGSGTFPFTHDSCGFGLAHLGTIFDRRRHARRL